jgi:hypothetical protein
MEVKKLTQPEKTRPTELSDAIDRVIADPFIPVTNHTEALRFILWDWLVSHGYLDAAPWMPSKNSEVQ